MAKNKLPEGIIPSNTNDIFPDTFRDVRFEYFLKVFLVARKELPSLKFYVRDIPKVYVEFCKNQLGNLLEGVEFDTFYSDGMALQYNGNLENPVTIDNFPTVEEIESLREMEVKCNLSEYSQNLLRIATQRLYLNADQLVVLEQLYIACCKIRGGNKVNTEDVAVAIGAFSEHSNFSSKWEDLFSKWERENGEQISQKFKDFLIFNYLGENIYETSKIIKTNQ